MCQFAALQIDFQDTYVIGSSEKASRLISLQPKVLILLTEDH